MDRVYRLSRMPRPGSGTHILESARVGGGVEANVAAALARLGVKTGLVSRVGDDADGAWALDDLQQWGVETTRVLAVTGQATDYCLVWVAPDGERMLACDNPSLRHMRLEQQDRTYLAAAQILFLSGFVPAPLALEVLELAHASGLQIVFDLPDSFDDLAARGLDRAAFGRLLPKIDLLVTNHLGLTSYLELEQAQVAFETFGRRFPKTGIAMTMGAKGAWLRYAGRTVYVEAFEVPVVDTTGAGDAFHAGLIYGLLEETWPLYEAGRFASALAALSCTVLGARDGLMGRDAVFCFLERTRKE